jgi:hypothetical protein
VEGLHGEYAYGLVVEHEEGDVFDGGCELVFGELFLHDNLCLDVCFLFGLQVEYAYGVALFFALCVEYESEFSIVEDVGGFAIEQDLFGDAGSVAFAQEFHVWMMCEKRGLRIWSRLRLGA